MPNELRCYQDGADFYADDGAGWLATAPFKVRDYDMAAAEAARSWFTLEWCANNNIQPLFTV